MYPRAHDEFVVALQDLQVVHIAVVGAVFWIVGDGFQWFPLRLKVVFQNIGALPLGAKRKGCPDAVAAVGGTDCENIAHAVEGDLLLYAEAILAADLALEEGPGDFTATEPVHKGFVGSDKFGLVVFENEGVAETDAGGAVFPVEGWDDNFVAEG